VGFNLDSIKNARCDRPRRIIVAGPPKVGKSTFACSADRPIVIPMKGEEGIDDLNVESFPVCEKFGELLEALGTVYADKHEFKTLVIDSVSALEPIVWDETRRINGGVDSIEKINGGYSKGYTEALKQWREIIAGLDAIRKERGMTILLITHTRVGKFNDPMLEPYDQYSYDIHDKASAFLRRWADGLLFVRRKIVVRKDDTGFNQTHNRPVDIGAGQPFLYTQERPAHPGGGRGVAWSKLPYEMPLSWAAFSEALALANA
jgi:hypothetical protein